MSAAQKRRRWEEQSQQAVRLVHEHLHTLEELFRRFSQAAHNAAQRQDYEMDLKREIKRLQRHRDAVFECLQQAPAGADRKELEAAQETVKQRVLDFWVFERDFKTKAFSNSALTVPDEGLGTTVRISKDNATKAQTCKWLRFIIQEINRNKELAEADLEAAGVRPKKGGGGKSNKRRHPLERVLSRLEYHVETLEEILRKTECGIIPAEMVMDISDNVEDFLMSFQNEDYEEDETLYDHLLALEDSTDGGDVIEAHDSLRCPRNKTKGIPAPTPVPISIPGNSGNGNGNTAGSARGRTSKRAKSNERGVGGGGGGGKGGSSGGGRSSSARAVELKATEPISSAKTSKGKQRSSSAKTNDRNITRKDAPASGAGPKLSNQTGQLPITGSPCPVNAPAPGTLRKPSHLTATKLSPSLASSSSSLSPSPWSWAERVVKGAPEPFKFVRNSNNTNTEDLAGRFPDFRASSSCNGGSGKGKNQKHRNCGNSNDADTVTAGNFDQMLSVSFDSLGESSTLSAASSSSSNSRSREKTDKTIREVHGPPRGAPSSFPRTSPVPATEIPFSWADVAAGATSTPASMQDVEAPSQRQKETQTARKGMNGMEGNPLQSEVVKPKEQKKSNPTSTSTPTSTESLRQPQATVARCAAHPCLPPSNEANVAIPSESRKRPQTTTNGQSKAAVVAIDRTGSTEPFAASPLPPDSHPMAAEQKKTTNAVADVPSPSPANETDRVEGVPSTAPAVPPGVGPARTAELDGASKSRSLCPTGSSCVDLRAEHLLRFQHPWKLQNSAKAPQETSTSTSRTVASPGVPPRPSSSSTAAAEPHGVSRPNCMVSTMKRFDNGRQHGAATVYSPPPPFLNQTTSLDRPSISSTTSSDSSFDEGANTFSYFSSGAPPVEPCHPARSQFQQQAGQKQLEPPGCSASALNMPVHRNPNTANPCPASMIPLMSPSASSSITNRVQRLSSSVDVAAMDAAGSSVASSSPKCSSCSGNPAGGASVPASAAAPFSSASTPGLSPSSSSQLLPAPSHSTATAITAAPLPSSSSPSILQLLLRQPPPTQPRDLAEGSMSAPFLQKLPEVAPSNHFPVSGRLPSNGGPIAPTPEADDV